MVSPQSTLVLLIVPSGSKADTESVMLCPVLAIVGDGVKLTTGGLSVIMTWEEVDPVTPPLSVTVSVTV
jgi:hypothetical protein